LHVKIYQKHKNLSDPRLVLVNHIIQLFIEKISVFRDRLLECHTSILYLAWQTKAIRCSSNHVCKMNTFATIPKPPLWTDCVWSHPYRSITEMFSSWEPRNLLAHLAKRHTDWKRITRYDFRV